MIRFHLFNAFKSFSEPVYCRWIEDEYTGPDLFVTLPLTGRWLCRILRRLLFAMPVTRTVKSGFEQVSNSLLTGRRSWSTIRRLREERALQGAKFERRREFIRDHIIMNAKHPIVTLSTPSDSRRTLLNVNLYNFMQPTINKKFSWAKMTESILELAQSA